MDGHLKIFLKKNGNIWPIFIKPEKFNYEFYTFYAQPEK